MARRPPAIVLIASAAILAPVFLDRPTTGGDPQPRQSRRMRGGGSEDPVPVLATAARRADVPVHIDGVGTVRAANTVTVRPQVDGRLLAITFREGQDVRKGDVLARIDPTLYKAQLDQALARKAQNEALLENAKRDLERYQRLAETNAVTRQQADTQRATVAQLEAQLRADQANIDNARATLAYTTVVAPIDGRTGIRAVDEGNIVRTSDPNGLVVISQIRPIAVVFTVPQQQLPRINAAVAKGPLTVEALDADNRRAVERGELQVVDNVIDVQTGTVRLKAEFPNQDLRLWPGAFINVRLLVETLRDVTVIPTGAVQRGPDGPFVYVVQDQKVAMRKVEVGLQNDADAVVTSGVREGEVVVTTGFGRLAEGARVTVSDGATPSPVPAEPSRRTPRGETAAGAGASTTR